MKRSRGRPRKVPTPPCVHHWMIDSLNVGKCKLCGQVKDFGALPLASSPKFRMQIERSSR